MLISEIISRNYLLDSDDYVATCRARLVRDGALVLPDFLTENAIEAVKQEGRQGMEQAYFCVSSHNVYLTPPDDRFAMDHPRNREVISSKGLIGDDQVPANSPLKTLYRDNVFQRFIAQVVGEAALYPYADPLSAVNIHYAKEGQELGWHFDNSSFAITLLIDKPLGGGIFEYVKDVRDADAGEYNFEVVGSLLDGMISPFGSGNATWNTCAVSRSQFHSPRDPDSWKQNADARRSCL